MSTLSFFKGLAPAPSLGPAGGRWSCREAQPAEALSLAFLVAGSPVSAGEHLSVQCISGAEVLERVPWLFRHQAKPVVYLCSRLSAQALQ